MDNKETDEFVEMLSFIAKEEAKTLRKMRDGCAKLYDARLDV